MQVDKIGTEEERVAWMGRQESLQKRVFRLAEAANCPSPVGAFTRGRLHLRRFIVGAVTPVPEGRYP